MADPARRIYCLPPSLHEEILAYQRRRGIASETEAARRLLTLALRYEDTAADILAKMAERAKTVTDLRRLAQMEVADHPNLKTLTFHPTRLVFSLTDGVEHSFPQEAS